MLRSPEGILTRMASAKVEYSSLSIAAFLALAMLTIFYKLQDYGPESAIRRFQAAIQSNHIQRVQDVTEERLDSRPVQNLIEYIAISMASGIPPQVERMERSKDQVRVAVVYTLPSGQRSAAIWIVDKTDGLWKINASQTWEILRNGQPD